MLPIDFISNVYFILFFILVMIPDSCNAMKIDYRYVFQDSAPVPETGR